MINDIMADYEAHFTDAAADGRSEADVTSALGDPARLARELRAEAGLKQWEDIKTPSSAVGALFAVLGLGALDILILLPLLMGIAGTLAGMFMASIGLFIAGGAIFVILPFTGMPGGVAAAILGGIALMASAVTLASLTAIATIWLVNGLVWFGRLHYRLISPALNSQN
jgi:uncharacterized membrane protein